MKCQVCGHENPDNATMCINCGSPLEREKVSEAIDDISGEATVLIGQPLVPPSGEQQKPPTPPPQQQPQAPPPPPPPQQQQAPPPPPAVHSQGQGGPMPPPPPPSGGPSGGGLPPIGSTASGDIDQARTYGYISLGLFGGSILACCLGTVTGTGGILGCIGVLMNIGGLVLGIMGKKAAQTDSGVKNLNLAGAVLNGLMIAINILIIVLVVVAGVALLGVIGAAGASGGM